MAASGGALAGVGVLVTRPAAQADTLVRLIEAEGGEAIRFPVVEILDPLDRAPLIALIDRLHEFDLALFISANAVNKAMNLIHARRTWPARLAAGCVGRASAKALKQFGRDALVPDGRFDSEALLALPALTDVRGKRIVIFRGDGGRELLGNTLEARGAVVEYAECYRRAVPRVDAAPLLKLWARGRVHVVTLTSVEALRNLFDLVGKLGQQWLTKTPVVALSDRIAQACRELGFKHAARVCAEASDEALVTALRAWRAEQRAAPQ